MTQKSRLGLSITLLLCTVNFNSSTAVFAQLTVEPNNPQPGVSPANSDGYKPPERVELVDITQPMDPAAAKQGLGELEQKCFNKVFNAQTIDARLDRLEQQLFGMGRIGDYKTRISALKTEVQSREGKSNTASTPIANTAKPSPDEEALISLEKRFYDKHDFSGEPQDERLMRLEELVFGEVKQGDFHSRLLSLQGAIGKSDDIARSPAGDANSAAKVFNQERKKHASFEAAMESGISDFKLKRYHSAQDAFEEAIAFNSRSPQAYVNLGNTLMMLKDTEGAQEAFKACYALQPFGEMGQYARKTLLRLAHDDAYYKTDPQDSPKFVATAIATINRQAADCGHRYISEASVFARNRIILGDIEARKIAAQTADTVSSLRGYGSGRRNFGGFANAGYGGAYAGYGGGYGGDTNGNYPAYGTGGYGGELYGFGGAGAYGPYGGYGGGFGANAYGYGGGGYGVGGFGAGYGGSGSNGWAGEISNLGAIRSNYVRTDAQVQANRANIEGYSKAASVQESATNLKDQMLQPLLPGDARLRALGTSLYARYYGDGMPSTDERPLVDPSLPGMHATAQSISAPVHNSKLNAD